MLKKLMTMVVLAAAFSLAFAQSTVEFATWGGTEDLDIYATLIDQFEAENPDVIVELIHIPSAGDYEQNLATLIAAGAAPDVFFINNISLPGFAAQDAFLPLEQFATPEFLEDFFPGHLDAFRHNGELMALPRDISNMVLFYNQDLFDAAGIAAPGEGWSWDDFMAAAQALTQDTDGDGAIDQFGFGYSTFYLFWQPWVWSNGGRFFSADHSEFTLNQGAALEGLEYYVGLRCDANVAPTGEQAAERSAASMFADGDAAMIVDGRWRVAPLLNNAAVDFNWDVALFPAGTAGSVIDVDGSGWGISSTSNDPEAAWRFIEFVSSAEAQAMWTEAGIIIPSRRSVGLGDSFVTPDIAPASDEIFIIANETGIPTETFEGFGEFLNLLNEGLSEVWLCQTSVADGLASVQRDIEDLLSDYQ